MQDQVKPIGNRGHDIGWEQKAFLRVTVPRAHELWVAQLPPDKQPDAPGQSTFRTWFPFWVRLVDARTAVGCVCVHHRTHEMLEAAINTLRCQRHRARCARTDGLTCRLGEHCDCACAACLVSQPLLQAAVCPTSSGQLPSIACILQHCPDCGLEKVLRCPRKENAVSQLFGSVRLMRSVTRSIAGQKDKDLWQPVSVQENLDDLFGEMEDKFGFVLMHDYLARRLAAQFRNDLYNLQEDEEVLGLLEIIVAI